MEEDELINISALSHFMYCQRRCALIHIEQMWTENVFTAEGRVLHDRVHEEGVESRKDFKTSRGLLLRSEKLGVTGKADVIEFHRIQGNVWQPFPIEHKRGKPKLDHSDTIQLCAQAICLEEMLNIKVPAGALFYGNTRRRLNVSFTEDLRLETEQTAKSTYQLILSGKTPPPLLSRRCKACSLFDQCLPESVGKSPVKRYIERMIHEKIS